MSVNRTSFLELSQELLNRGSSLRFQAHGTSMHPFIRDGNILVVTPLNGSSSSIGDILFYRRPGGAFTAHRLVRKTNNRDDIILITRGDSLGHFDPPVSYEQVMGKAVCIEAGKKQLWLNTRPGRLLAIFIALFARGRYPQQLRFVRNLGRLWWFVSARKIKQRVMSPD